MADLNDYQKMQVYLYVIFSEGLKSVPTGQRVEILKSLALAEGLFREKPAKELMRFFVSLSYNSFEPKPEQSVKRVVGFDPSQISSNEVEDLTKRLKAFSDDLDKPSST